MGVREAILARPGLATSLLYCLLQSGGAGYERAVSSRVECLQPGRVVCNWDDGQEPTVRELSG